MTTSTAFLCFVSGVALAAIAVAVRWLGRRAAAIAVGLVLWLVFVGAVSRSGALADPTLRPPAILHLAGPIALIVLLAIVSRTAGQAARAVPAWALVGLQIYRVGVELFLHQLWHEGLVPRMLTFEGANVDIWIGASAPLAACLATRGPGGRRIALAWNGLGLLALANVVARSALTAPGPLHLLDVEVANRLVGTFPYTYVAGFLAPLALTLHVLALRALSRPHEVQLADEMSGDTVHHPGVPT